MEDASNGTKPNVRLVTRIVVGERNFESEGYCYVKTTALVDVKDKDGRPVYDGNGQPERRQVVEHMKLPIRSAGIREILEDVEKRRPKPTATVVEMISGDTEVGRQLGVPKGKSKPYRLADLEDPDYKDRLRAHERATMFAIINQGLAVDFVAGPPKKHGDPPEGTPIPATEALETMKMSLAQFTEIQEAIEALTKSTDAEREDFTGRRSTSARIPETPTV